MKSKITCKCRTFVNDVQKNIVDNLYKSSFANIVATH